MSNEELVSLHQSGDSAALTKLIEQNRGIVNKVSNKFYVEGTNSISKEDLEQEGYIGLVIAANKYDLNNSKRAMFTTYAIYWVYQRINSFIHKKNTNSETSLNSPVGSEGDTEIIDFIEGADYSFENVEDRLYNQQLREELEGVMRSVNTLMEIEILKFHYGWDSKKDLNFSEIGELYDLSAERIRQIENRALRKIRQSDWAIKKAKDIYINKKRKSLYSIDKTVEVISFAQRYL